MNLDDLEEELENLLSSNFRIELDSHGQVVIFTGLEQDEDGELVEHHRDEDDEEDEDEDSDYDDSDLEPLDEEFDDDE